MAVIATVQALCQIISLGSNLNQLKANDVIQDAAGTIYAAGQNGGDVTATPRSYQTDYTATDCSNYVPVPPITFPTVCSTRMIAKFSPAGETIWATYLGGTNQPGEKHSDSVDKLLLDSCGISR